MYSGGLERDQWHKMGLKLLSFRVQNVFLRENIFTYYQPFREFAMFLIS